MSEALTYLDYNATAPVRPEAKSAVMAALELGGNPSSVHRQGRLARRVIEDAREQVAALAGVPSGTVTFTSGGTEALNLAIASAVKTGDVKRIMVSAIEHDAVKTAAAGIAGSEKIDLVELPVLQSGVIDISALQRLLDADIRTLVAVMAVNNETGVIQPSAEIGEMVREAGAFFLCDAVQAAGRIDLARVTAVADYVALSAHKIGGPQGTGALIAGDGAPISSEMRGGRQERGHRAGTENVPGIAGFGAAAEVARNELNDQRRLEGLRDDLEARLASIAHDAVFFGREADRVSNTSAFSVSRLPAETTVMALDLAGVSISAGAACSSGKVAPSGVVTAMGYDTAIAAGAVRVSLGWASEGRDIDRFVSAWSDHYERNARGLTGDEISFVSGRE